MNSVRLWDRGDEEHFHEIVGGSSDKTKFQVIIGDDENMISAKVETYGK